MDEKDLEKDIDVVEEKDVEAEVVETNIDNLEVIQAESHMEEGDNTVVEEFPPIESLEAEKAAFVKTYKKSQFVSYIVVALMIVVVVVSYVWLFKINQWAGIVPIIVALIGSTVFNNFHRKKITAKVRLYMDSYNRELNRIVLDNSEFENYVYDFNALIESDDFIKARILKDIVNTNSRNLMRYDIGHWNVSLADFVAYRPDGKRATAAFHGKFLSASRDKSIDGRIIVYLKPDPNFFKDGKGPDDIEDLEVISDDPNYTIYATDAKTAKFLNKEALAKLLEVKPSNQLADVLVSIYENKVAVTLSYGSDLMVVPYKEPVPVAAIHKYADDVTVLNAFFTLLK